MFLQHLTRWLQGGGTSAPPSEPNETCARTPDAPGPAIATPGQPLAAGSAPQAPAGSILQVDEQKLERDRESVAQLQQDTFQRIRRLQGDIQGIASRHAQARATGRPAEKAALVRIFSGLRMQLAKAEQFHADLANHRQLLDNLAATREFAVLRHRLQQGVLAGLGFVDLRRMVDASLAAELHERTQTTELLHGWAQHDEDAALQHQASLSEAEDQLTALSETEYQARVQAEMQPLEAVADRVAQGLDRVCDAAAAKPLAADAGNVIRGGL